MKKSHFGLWAILGGGLILVLAVYGFWKVWTAPVDTSLTPAHLAPRLSTTEGRFEVLVAGVPLQKAIADKRLLLASETGAATLVVPEATVRVNDAERIRAQRVPSLLALSAIAGGGFVLFLIGLFTPMIGAFKPHGLIDPHLDAA